MKASPLYMNLSNRVFHRLVVSQSITGEACNLSLLSTSKEWYEAGTMSFKKIPIASQNRHVIFSRRYGTKLISSPYVKWMVWNRRNNAGKHSFSFRRFEWTTSDSFGWFSLSLPNRGQWMDISSGESPLNRDLHWVERCEDFLFAFIDSCCIPWRESNEWQFRSGKGLINLTGCYRITQLFTIWAWVRNSWTSP